MAAKRPPVNNAFYEHLGERWFTAQDDPVALLRAEGEVKHAWVEDRLRAQLDPETARASMRILDIGCGAGFLTRRLSALGYKTQGLDRSRGSLRMAQSRDADARYQQGDALRLPFRDHAFDAVCAMDFLEHVEDPAAVVAEAGRVLRPGGLFFFHTFNRNFWSWLIVIKGLEWFVRNTPPRMHVLRLFIRPEELENYCRAFGMEVKAWTGVKPDIFRRAFWRLLSRGVVPEDFRFVLTPSLRLSYLGMAKKNRSS